MSCSCLLQTARRTLGSTLANLLGLDRKLMENGRGFLHKIPSMNLADGYTECRKSLNDWCRMQLCKSLVTLVSNVPPDLWQLDRDREKEEVEQRRFLEKHQRKEAEFQVNVKIWKHLSCTNSCSPRSISVVNTITVQAFLEHEIWISCWKPYVLVSHFQLWLC